MNIKSKLEHGALCFRKPRGKKLTTMMVVTSQDSGAEFIRRDMPIGEYVYVWMDSASGENREFSIVPDFHTFGHVERPGASMSDQPKRIKPHSLFKVWSADEVAECLEGVSAVTGLYEKLWSLMIERVNTPGESYREIPDDYADRCLSKSWSKLTREQQSTLNDLAAKYYAVNAMSR